MLKEILQNYIPEDWTTTEEITESIVSIGMGHNRESISRELRDLSSQGLIDKEEGRPPKYRRKIRQTQLI